MPRVGLGYDVHRLVAGRPLVLGGIRFESELGLLGHSDADVLLHAIMDALLGAAALGDIGRHFPPSDPAYEGADSLRLATKVADMLYDQDWRIVNVDATLIAEQPRISARVPEMQQAIAQALRMPSASVGIKATTNEGLGALGRGEGIAALAVALIETESQCGPGRSIPTTM